MSDEETPLNQDETPTQHDSVEVVGIVEEQTLEEPSLSVETGASKSSTAGLSRKTYAALAAMMLIASVLGAVASSVILNSLDNAKSVQRPETAKQPVSNEPVNARVPANANQESTGWSLKTVANVPTLVLWEDPQCPFCAQFHQTFDGLLADLQAQGLLNVEYRMVSFLDFVLEDSKNASHRAVNAIGCALDISPVAADAYHKTVYANHPATEGQGWTDTQLIAFADQMKITDVEKNAFKACLARAPYLSWSDRTTQLFAQAGFNGTPTLQINGRTVDLGALAKLKTIEEAADFFTGKTTVYK